MKIERELVDRTRSLLSCYENLLDSETPVSSHLRVKLTQAELCLFKVALLLEKEVDRGQGRPYTTPELNTTGVDNERIH